MSATLPPLQLPLVRPSRVFRNEETGEYEIRALTKLDAPPPPQTEEDIPPQIPGGVVVTITGEPTGDPGLAGSYTCPLMTVQTITSEYGAITQWIYQYENEAGATWGAVYSIGPGLGPDWDTSKPWVIGASDSFGAGGFGEFNAYNVPFNVAVPNQYGFPDGSTGKVSG